MRVSKAAFLVSITVLSLSSCALSTTEATKESSVDTDRSDKRNVHEESSSELTAKGAARKNRRVGRLSLYRRGALKAIAAQFDAELAEGDPEVRLVIARDGKVLSAEIVQKSDPVSDEEALKAIGASTFEMLPAEYEGDCVELRIRFRRVRQIRSQL